MARICPNCKGDQEIKDDESGLWIGCGKCDGQGTIPENKIREEFKPFDLFYEKFTEEERNSNIDYRLVRCLEYIKKLEAAYKSRDKEIRELKQILENLIVHECNWKHCPNCPDQGWYISGDPYEPEQCEFCYTEQWSIFNQTRLKEALKDDE